MKIKFLLSFSCLLISTSLIVLPIQKILGQQTSPTNSESNTAPDSTTTPGTAPVKPESNTVPDSTTTPDTTPVKPESNTVPDSTTTPDKTPVTSPAPTTTPAASEFSQLPCDNDQQLASPPQLTGKPTWENSTYKYYGTINPKTKEANGRGLMIFKNNGFQYYGDFKRNKRHGCGRLLYPDDSNVHYYLGQFKDDKLQGLGRLKLRNKNEYRGAFVNNRCQGRGIYVFDKDKFEQDGTWYGNKLEGINNFSCNDFNNNYR